MAALLTALSSAAIMIPSLYGRAALIVNQDPDTRRMFAEYLRLARVHVDEAEEGREALAKALGRRYDVIIMDTRLPGIDGYQLTRVLRRDPITETVPIVVVTGEGTSSACGRARECGANAVFVKPAMADAVLAQVRQLLAAPLPGLRADDARDTPAGAGRTHTLTRAHRRGETLAPPIQPPKLLCPQCDDALVYQRSYVGGVSAKHSEQWDEYECRNGCGSFQYRQRTRHIRQR